MKSLIFLFMSVFLFAHSQTKPPNDSSQIKMQILSEQASTNLKLAQENNFLFQKLIQKRSKKNTKSVIIAVQNKEDIKAVKPEEIKPEIEIPFMTYPEVIRGNFLYRFFHKDDFKIKYYRLQGDEKIYLN